LLKKVIFFFLIIEEGFDWKLLIEFEIELPCIEITGGEGIFLGQTKADLNDL